jgi:hypothetical protein
MDPGRTRRTFAAGTAFVVALLGSACDKVGPPTQDVGFEHSVQPQKGAATGGTSRGTEGRRSAPPTPPG